MHIIATFEQSLFLELALTDLEIRGIDKEKILVVPLEKKRKGMRILDTIHQADGVSVIDSACLSGTLASVVFSIFGFVWPGGPLLWGLVGLIGGFAVGLGADYLLTSRERRGEGPPVSAEVVVIIRCEQEQLPLVEEVLQDNLVLAMAKVYSPSP